jgi:putative ABC transport system substrate-binding protein
VFVPHNPDDGSSVAGLAASKEAANKLGIQLVVHEARTAEQLNLVFARFPEDVDAILVPSNNMALDRIADFVKVAQERHLPLASVSYTQLEAGTLMTYGPDFFQVGRQAARLADKVLKGTSPADLPVETSEYFLSVNLITAQAIGLAIPDEVLQQADRVIR